MADINSEIIAWETLLTQYSNDRPKIIIGPPGLPIDDIRVAIYGLPANVFVSTVLSLKMASQCLLDPAWWDHNVRGIDPLNRQQQADEFFTQLRISTFILFFSFYESILRAFVRTMSPGTCNDGFASYQSIYACLLTRLDLKQHLPVMDFGRTIRNLIHNNGVYRNKGKKDEEMLFRGSIYRFEHKRKVNFAYIEVLFAIYEDMLGLANAINDHPDTRKLPVSRP